MRQILEGFAALVLLVAIQTVAIGFVWLLADHNGFWPTPPALAVGGLIGLGLWFCVIYTIHHKSEINKIV